MVWVRPRSKRRIRSSVPPVRRAPLLMSLLYALLCPTMLFAQASGPIESLISSGEFEARFVEDRDHISVIELIGNYSRQLEDGSFNLEPRTLIAQEFYLQHPDNFDFLIIFTTFEFNTSDPDSGDVLAFHLGVQNQVSGIGLPVFDNTDFFGSEGRLLGYVDMAALGRWKTDPLNPDFEQLLATMAHEVMHQWCCFVEFNGPESSALLGAQDAHWSFLLDTDASIMYGHDWRDQGDGTFLGRDARRFYSPLDLYLAGFFAPEEVQPFFLIDNPEIDRTRLPERGATVSGTASPVTLDDIIAVEGLRSPSAAESQKDFRAAFILLKRPGDEVTSGLVAALSRVRDAFQTRFSVVTGGRAIVQVFPEARLDVARGEPSGIDPGTIRPTEASIADGLAWLRLQQTTEGFWEDTPPTRLRDTTVSLEMLSDLDPVFAGKARALDWIGALAPPNVDGLARQARSLTRLLDGGEDARSELLDLQNEDGGWGLSPGFRSDPLDTALAVLALGDRPGVEAAMSKAGDFLVAHQNLDGGWSNVLEGASRARVTTLVLAALKAVGRQTEVSTRALEWLASRQNPDGGFGDSPSTVHDTASVLRTVIALDALATIRAEEAGSYLRTRQTLEGSWAGSTYATALAIDALQRSAFLNWRFAGPIQASPAEPRDGDRVELTLQVANDGATVAPSGLVRFFDGDPDSGGVSFADVELPSLSAGRTATVKVFWDSFDLPGNHTLVAVLDPDSAVNELSELDNRARLDIEVAPAPAEADLEIRPVDIVVTPPAPATLPTTLGFSVQARNLGRTDAADVSVEFWVGSPEGGELLETKMVNFPQRQTTVVNFSYLLLQAGVTHFTFRLDPEDDIVEASEGNNRASTSVTTLPTLDLEVVPADVELVDGAALRGEDATFRITLRNRGTVDTPSTAVRYAILDGGSVIELGRNVLQLDGGETLTQTVLWRVDRIGDLSFLAELDPDASVPEVDETNNLALLPFTTEDIGPANLSIRSLELSFAPDPGLEGAPVTLAAVVNNSGGELASNVMIAFYDGNPGEGGELIGTTVISELAPAASVMAEFVWSPVPDAGDRFIFVVADPDDLIPEFREDDNSGFKKLEVLSLPDLAISPAALRLEPRFPRPGDTVTLTLTNSNLGEQGADGVVAQAFEGDPDGAGMQVGGDQVFSVAGLAGAEVSFTWTFTGGETRPIVALLDPADLILESSKVNNRAQINVAAQEGNVFVTHRHISPNGDGIQDSTELFYGLDEPADVRIEVRNERDEVVRTSDVLSGDTGSFEWDGLDHRGRLVTDADYALLAVGSAGTTIGRATVSVDTNRSSLLRAVGTDFELFTNLTCELPTVSYFQTTDDEEFFYFAITGTGDPLFARGIYRVDSSGGGLQELIPADFFSATESPNELRVNRTGTRIAFEKGFRGEIWTADGRGNNRRPVINQIGTDIVDFAEGGETLLVRRESGRLLEAHPLGGFLPPREVFRGTGSLFDITISPDERQLVLRQFSSGPATVLVGIATGEMTDLGVVSRNHAWSPDGQRLAVVDQTGPEPQLVIFDARGERLRTIRFPLTPHPDQESGDLELDFVETPSWSSFGDELVVRVSYSIDFFSFFFDRLFVVNTVTGEVESIAQSHLEVGESYRIHTWDGTAWVARGVLHYGLEYAEQELDLSEHLPDADGEFKVKITQSGHEAAHVDNVTLRVGDHIFLPDRALRDDTGDDVLDEVGYADYEVIDLHERGVELGWSGLPEGEPVRLNLIAREETLSGLRVRPLRYPREEGVYNYRLSSEEGLKVDGLQTSADGLDEPLFEQWSKPDTGHPAATVVGWAGSDDEHLYAALDFTVDNTVDGGRDWAELQVLTSEGVKAFRITTADSRYGIVGFTHTGRVLHPHKYYEFKIPLAEIGAAPGDVLSLAFEAYGSAAETLEDDDFIDTFGDDFWVPNERAVLDSSFSRTLAFLLDEDNRRVELFEDFNHRAVRGFSPTGRQLLFQSRDARNDVTSPCFLRGFADEWSFRSLMNLTADLRARRSSTVGGVLIEGTAADLHFSHYTLEFARASSPGSFSPIGPPAAEPVVDARFTTWVPPSPGSYLVRLTVHDLAGNQRRAVKRVSWNDIPSITDLFRTPQFISPNGDGIQDSATVGYRVLEPISLEFGFFNDKGDRVRTIERDHPVIGLQELVWDGRDQRGLPVPDGEYRMTVQNFEFFIHVDSTPPEVELLLKSAYQRVNSSSSGEEVAGVSPQLVFTVVDPNLKEDFRELGEGADPLSWSPLTPGFLLAEDDGSLTRFLDLDEFVGNRFRLDASDRAGNRTLVTTPLGLEEIVVTDFGSHILSEEGKLERLEEVRFVPTTSDDGIGAFIQLAQGDARFNLAETVREEIDEVHVQFRPFAQVFWQETRIEQFLPVGFNPVPPSFEIPEPRFQFVWDMAGVMPGVVTVLRLRMVDLEGNEHFSNTFQVLTDGLFYGGPLPTPPDEPPADVARFVEEKKNVFGLRDIVLWAQEFMALELEEIQLFIQSDEDPRYANEQSFEPKAVTDGVILFGFDDWVACKAYKSFVVVVTEPFVDPATGETARRRIRSREVGFKSPCLTISVEIAPVVAESCGDPAPQLLQFVVTPDSGKGTSLQLLTMARLLPDGQEDILFSVNRPPIEEPQRFLLETQDLEPIESFVFRLSDVDDDRTERTIRLPIDQSPPTIAINFPLEGQRICGVPREIGGEIRNVFDVEGVVDDDVAAEYRLVLSRDGQAGLTFEISPPLVVPLGAAGGFRIAGTLGTYGDDEPAFTGDATLRLEASDWGGALVCTETNFFFDGEVEGAGLRSDLRLFSPNGDGTLDDVTLEIESQELAFVDLEIFPGFIDEKRRPVVTGSRVRTLLSRFSLLDLAFEIWDGTNDGGARVPDGTYLVFADYEDACGNRARRWVEVEVDNTPPETNIAFPQLGDPITMIVEVVGSVSDRNFQAYGLDFGIGLAPETWARIFASATELDAEVAGVWNTFGLEGDITLRLLGRDLAGNEGETFVSLNLASRTNLIQDLEATPRLFSPNGDGRRETSSIRFALDIDARVFLTLLEPGDVPVRTLVDGQVLGFGAAVRPWDGKTDGGDDAPDGLYAVLLRAELPGNPSVNQEERVTVIVDRTPPVVVLDAPEPDGFLTGEAAIQGSIEDERIQSYVISITNEPAAPVWTELARGNANRMNAILARLDALEDGDYAVRVEAEDQAENRAEVIIPFEVDNTAPVVTLTGPAEGSFLSGASGPTPVLGTVVEEHLETYRVEFAPGAAPLPDAFVLRGDGVANRGGAHSVGCFVAR